VTADPVKRLAAVRLDEATIARSTPDIEHERRVAIFDLVEDNTFALDGHDGGPYELDLAIVENRLVFQVSADGASAMTHVLSLSPFRKIVKDYWMICESYYAAIRAATPSQIETIDMARRGLHNEGSTILIERLAGKITVDFDTARRLFTLICVLHWKG
jgi:uncharacterized protein (UPF0262 family)